MSGADPGPIPLPPDLQQEPVDTKWRWRWGDWVSHPFDELEVRGWTPLLISGRLCFSARENGAWHVVFGDEVSPAYEDAYDTTEWRGKPLYIALQGGQWFLVWGSQRSQTFPFLIRFDPSPQEVMIKPCAGSASRRSSDGEPLWVQAQWEPEAPFPDPGH